MLKDLALILGAMCMSMPAFAANTVVTQSHTSFDVDDASLVSGDTITFSNKDDVTHNIQVTDSSGNTDDKGLQKPGQDIVSNFTKPGEYKVHCAIHPKMKMVVTVK